MKQIALILLAGLTLAAGQTPNDASAQFPSLQTTVRDPRADAGAELTACAILDGRRLCDEALASAWCLKQGFARFINWSTLGESRAGCREDASKCAVVATITCARPPIV